MKYEAEFVRIWEYASEIISHHFFRENENKKNNHQMIMKEGKLIKLAKKKHFWQKKLKIIF